MSHRDSWLTLPVRRDSASQLVRSSSLGWRDEAALRREILPAVPSQLPGKGLPSAAAKLRGRAEAAAEAADRIRSNRQKHRDHRDQQGGHHHGLEQAQSIFGALQP